MSNDPLKFWITCPDCKTPFGVEPRLVLQYLNRVLDAKLAGGSRERAGESAAQAQENRAEMPKASQGDRRKSTPQAPYRSSRPWRR